MVILCNRIIFVQQGHSELKNFLISAQQEKTDLEKWYLVQVEKLKGEIHILTTKKQYLRDQLKAL